MRDSWAIRRYRAWVLGPDDRCCKCRSQLSSFFSPKCIASRLIYSDEAAKSSATPDHRNFFSGIFGDALLGRLNQRGLLIIVTDAAARGKEGHD